ncbi:MAG: hypothetical protein ABJN96_06240 [Marinomonas sp.]|uniref:RSP_7527 family protein n=1 Tax=Marinomonas sp. GJ51-6 TaxID=2992802 RepID=UPI002934DB1E|nr:hypothetical protein [Marinomonas sp. GJ51-6]WOD06041.1 hypothetical protein ONZ50_09785 [Marinomonas sp. GJ51-6]
MKNDIKYDTFNNVDVDYYVEQAYKLRRDYYASAIKKAVARVKNVLANLTVSRPLKSA